MWRSLLSCVLLFTVLVTRSSAAEVIYGKEDRATVRVFAVRGVSSQKVEPPRYAAQKVALTIAVPEGGHGSGCIISEDGLIVTAQHVIDDARFVAVKVPEVGEAVMARVIYENEKHDIAFLKIPGTYASHVPVPKDDVPLSVRKTVFALGYPLDGTRAFPQSTNGVLSGTLPSGELQVGISVNPGNSGGPLIDETGRFLGIVVRRLDPKEGGEGLAFAVPSSVVRKYLDRRVLGSKRLSEETADRDPAVSSAEFVMRLATVSSLGTAIAHIEADDEKLARLLTSAEQSQKSSPDFMTLLSAHYWNESVVRYALDGRSWEKPLGRALDLARRAFERDATIKERSPFIEIALKSKSGRRDGPLDQISIIRSPRGLAGFHLGVERSVAQDACLIEDLTVTPISSGFSCNKPPIVSDHSGPIQVKFCGDRVCRIEVFDRPSRALSLLWVEALEKTVKGLRARYGDFASADVVVPQRCQKQVLKCLENGEAKFVYRWRFQDRALVLSLGRFKGAATMRLSLFYLDEKSGEGATKEEAD